MLLLWKILYVEKKYFNIACQYLDIMDEYLLFEYLLFNINFSPWSQVIIISSQVIIMIFVTHIEILVLRPFGPNGVKWSPDEAIPLTPDVEWKA